MTVSTMVIFTWIMLMIIIYFLVVILDNEMYHVYFNWFGLNMRNTDRENICLWIELGYGFELV